MSNRKQPETDNRDAENALEPQCRMRLFYHKGNKAKYISHLDTLRAWERAIRRSDLPLAYSQGFSPHPKITIAMPLAVGCTGENEALDIILTKPIPEQSVVQALTPIMPPGFTVAAAQEVALKSPALSTLFEQAIYDILLVEMDRGEIQHRIDDLLAQETIPIEFRRKRFDLRPLIGSLKLRENTLANAQRGELGLQAVLLRDERGRIGRPDVLIEALNLSEYVRGIHRTWVVYRTET